MFAKSILFIACFISFTFSCLGAGSTETTSLKENLAKANQGDFIVTAQSKTLTLLHIYGKTLDTLTIEEISVPQNKLCLPAGSWKEWVKSGAPKHTSWVLYAVDLPTGQIKKFYKYTKNGWYEMTLTDNFLPTLLNLELHLIPVQDRKKVGPPPSDGPDFRQIWHPKMVFEGKAIDGVKFNGWRTRWPKDNSELSGRLIEVYIPEENDKYPSYFPYWLQISGMAGKAKVRIVDSGTGLTQAEAANPNP